MILSRILDPVITPYLDAVAEMVIDTNSAGNYANTRIIVLANHFGIMFTLIAVPFPLGRIKFVFRPVSGWPMGATKKKDTDYNGQN